MDTSYLLTLGLTGFAVAFLHAAIPTHWLPFVMVGRTRGWSHRRTYGAVALAGGGHLVATTALGVAIARFGFSLDHHFEEAFHWTVAVVLVGLGGWLALRAPHGRACRHCQGQPEKFVPDVTDRAALWGLFLTLTLSPCELFLPVYLTAAPYGWTGVIWLSLVLAIATLGGMLLLTALTLRGATHLNWAWLRQPSPRMIGGLLAALGIATVAVPHGH